MFPRRYYVDTHGHRVLIGLTVRETAEFEALDEPSPVADEGGLARNGLEAMPITEVRWLELYTKHAGAWQLWNMSPGVSPHLDS